MSSPSTTASPAPDLLGYGFAISGAVLFSTKGIFIKLAYQYGVGTETVLALRMLVAVPVYAAILAWLLRDPAARARLNWRVVLASMAVGILGYYVSSFLDFAGLNFTTAQYERLVLFTYPFFGLIFGVWFFGDRMSWSVVPGMLLAYAGLLVIFGWNLATDPDGLVVGTLLILGSAITFALYQHFAKQQMTHIGSGLFTCIAMIAAGACSITHSSVQHGLGSWAALPQPVWIYGLCLGLVGTVIPSFLLNTGIARIGARAASVTGAFGPLVTIAIAVAVLGEPFTMYHAIGTAMVLAGALWFGRADTKAKAAAPLEAEAGASGA
ncbi:MAG TPA: DMT family transporter [Polyangiaceae bacterium]|nr:DMT family transporter [Polyangiaceae bacterium]